MDAAEYDVAVIGAGSAGFAAARVAADAGLRVLVLEGGAEVGGLCILRGCMPTKALLYASEVMHLASHPQTWGIHTQGVGFDFAQVMARKNAMIDDFASYRRGQLEKGTFEFARARAEFLDGHRIRLSDGRTLAARHFVISTGSVVAPAPLPFLDELGFITSDDALTLQRLPKSLIILGGGAVAVEFAQFFARFGVKVTLVQRSPHILTCFDTDAAEVIEAVFRREGIELFTNTRLSGGSRKNGQKELIFRHGAEEVTIAAEEILFALGRSPNTADLNLAAAGVEIDRGQIIANAQMRTSAPHIFAAGDCTSPHEIVHVAIQQAEIAAHNIIHPHQPREIDYRLLISIVFSDPQAAQVGLTEKEALEAKVPYCAASHPFADHGKSMIMEAKDGFVKLLANPDNGEIIGGTCVGPMGGELIHEIVAAMSKRMTVHELATLPHYHPTLAEIWTYPAEELAAKIKAPQRR